MHPEALAVMVEVVQRWTPSVPAPRGGAAAQHGATGRPVRCLDVGAVDVNGTYRPLIESRGWHYTGLDLVPGRNVDVVTQDPYRFPFEDQSFEVVISGSTMEHVKAIWLWVPELARVLTPGGMLAIITHTQWAYHPHPVDCWRVMPDGLRYLFDLTGQLERYEIRMTNQTDILGLAWKQATSEAAP